MAVQETVSGDVALIHLQNLWWVAAALAVMVGVIVSGDVFFLNFMHVFAGLLWTGIDLFMGFVLGPVLRQLDFASRRAVVSRLMPRTIFLMPTLATITGTTGWYLSERLGFLDLPFPARGWVVAALVIMALLAAQGLGYMLPTSLRVCRELQKPQPDFPKMTRWTRSYLRVTAFQGAMQVAIVLIMAKFVTGL